MFRKSGLEAKESLSFASSLVAGFTNIGEDELDLPPDKSRPTAPDL